MRQATLRAGLSAIVLSLSALVAAPAASAAGADTMEGGCFFDSDRQQAVTGNTYTGVIGDKSVTLDGNNMPIGATVSCAVAVNGTIVPSTVVNYSGPGVQAGANTISYDAQDYDWVDLVYRVVYADGTDTGWVYPCLDCNPFVLQRVIDAINQVLTDNVDPEVCPALVAHPGAYGPVTIAADGDVYVNDPLNIFTGTPVYDCPPYGNY